MKTQGLRLLGWALHAAFFAAWIQVAVILEARMHDEPRPAAASSSRSPAAEAVAGTAPEAAMAARAARRAKTSAGNARDPKTRAG
ncbi:MAG: hypothetical protein HZC37_03770 [Burkholderiales bacterium]|nr:hypothetical protein [Burkholderiales bacterium]